MMMNNISQRKYLFTSTLVLFLTYCFIFPLLAQAATSNTAIDPPLVNYSINVDQPTILKGYTVNPFKNQIKLSLDPGTLSTGTQIEISQLPDPVDLPWSINKLSTIYQFEFKNKLAYNDKHPFFIQLNYDKASSNYKQVFFFDKNFNSWRPLPTKDYPEEKFVRSLIHLPYARIAVFEFPNVLSTGSASWYNYKHGLFAASPDFPAGSKLRIFNADNNKKFVDVVVNDYGPNRDVHPTRVLDMDKVAFAQIAPLGQGTVKVIVEPIFIASVNNEILGVPATGIKTDLAITAKAAVVINSKSGSLIWSKLANTPLPIASLTKLASMSVFLETKPDLSKVVTYSNADDEFNYQYAKKWEIARLSINQGETLTEENLLYSALVGSANNAVESLVRVSGLSRTDFISRMNTLVASWGASSTKFIEPTGLSPQNVSSAFDYAIISNKALSNPLIEKITKINSYKFTTINSKKSHTIVNTNHLVALSNLTVTGSKTGYLDEAGYCLMTRALDKNNHQVIVVTLGAKSRQISFDETEELANYGLYKIQ